MSIQQPTVELVKVNDRRTRPLVGLGLLLLASLVYVHLVFGEEIAWWLRLLLLTMFGFAVLALVLWLVHLVLALQTKARLDQERICQEKARTAELELNRLKIEAEVQAALAQARKAEQELEFSCFTTKQDEAFYVRDLNPRAVWRLLHINPRHRVNGVDTPPSPLEIATWQQWQSSRYTSLPGPTPASLPSLTAGSLPERIDLLELYSGRSSLRHIVLGVRLDENGQVRPVTAPLHRMVHIGAAGATDSGKSNFGRVLALQVVTAVEEVELVFVDLKGTTFKIFQQSARLRYPLVTSPSDFMAAMSDLYREMERRKVLFKPHLTVETLADYNRIAEKQLPTIAVFVDEVSNLFMNKETQRIALTLVRESRAFGIHFITLGQSWSHKEMNTSFREQHQTTGHFGTNNPHSSRMMIHKPDAVHITVPGRAYFILPFGMSRDVVEIQTPFLDPATVLRLLPTSVTPPSPIPRPVAIESETVDEGSELNVRAAKILELWDSGVRVRKDLCEQVYGPGRTGGRYYELVEKVLHDHGRW